MREWAIRLVCFIYVFILKNERFAHSLFFGEQCEQIAKVAQQKLAMWANPSGRSLKMSNNKRFAQVAHQKWGTMSESLRSLTTNEWMSESLVYLSKSLLRSFFRKKRAIRSENQWANSQPCKMNTNHMSAGYNFYFLEKGQNCSPKCGTNIVQLL